MAKMIDGRAREIDGLCDSILAYANQDPCTDECYGCRYVNSCVENRDERRAGRAAYEERRIEREAQNARDRREPPGTDAAAMDAMFVPFHAWRKLHGKDKPDIETREDLRRWWDHLEAQSDWQLSQRYGVGL